MATLQLSTNGFQAGAGTMDLSAYLNLTPDSQIDPAAATYSDRVFSHSLLKEGGLLALEHVDIKEQIFPLELKAVNTPALNQLVVQINQLVNTPGCVAMWQDDGASQPTYFDLASGQADVAYSYRKAAAHWLHVKLRLFSQPFGRTAGPRPYAAASGVGPLLIISPYASSGQYILGASTQAGIAGYGGQQQASGGVFYGGNPSLAGDAPALLQISYEGPVAPVPSASLSTRGLVPYVAVSLLPDSKYQPLMTTADIYYGYLGATSNTVLQNDPGAVASSYLTIARRGVGAVPSDTWSINPLRTPSGTPFVTSALRAGNHRLFAIARASMAAGALWTLPGPLVPISTAATVYPADWALYDLGTFTLRASETSFVVNPVFGSGGSPAGVFIQAQAGMSSPSSVLDVSAFVMLPDNTTWYLNPTNIQPSQYGAGAYRDGHIYSFPWGVYTNTLLLDDTLSDQFIYYGGSLGYAPSPIGMAASAARITPYSRGLVPRPDPKNGLPIIAIVGVGQNSVASTAYPNDVGASWTNQQNLATYAQISVLERTRYVLP